LGEADIRLSGTILGRNIKKFGPIFVKNVFWGILRTGGVTSIVVINVYKRFFLFFYKKRVF